MTIFSLMISLSLLSQLRLGIDYNHWMWVSLVPFKNFVAREVEDCSLNARKLGYNEKLRSLEIWKHIVFGCGE